MISCCFLIRKTPPQPHFEASEVRIASGSRIISIVVRFQFVQDSQMERNLPYLCSTKAQLTNYPCYILNSNIHLTNYCFFPEFQLQKQFFYPFFRALNCHQLRVKSSSQVLEFLLRLQSAFIDGYDPTKILQQFQSHQSFVSQIVLILIHEEKIVAVDIRSEIMLPNGIAAQKQAWSQKDVRTAGIQPFRLYSIKGQGIESKIDPYWEKLEKFILAILILLDPFPSFFKVIQKKLKYNR
ncbi:MAG: hypothetical protein EZS28_007170 [Streblomastix strix]|uniref:Uncharacterized protein n=1 Tax=Streblomastix strix TaxID=222440 RepID=A0A5J4WSB2_9EUKA|nr:MAG: hypothetical protein EZS28_007170 [Streblomastix strix]